MSVSTIQPVVTVQIIPPPVVEVDLAGVGPQGPPGPAIIWVGPTPPDPAQYPLWLDNAP